MLLIDSASAGWDYDKEIITQLDSSTITASSFDGTNYPGNLAHKDPYLFYMSSDQIEQHWIHIPFYAYFKVEGVLIVVNPD